MLFKKSNRIPHAIRYGYFKKVVPHGDMVPVRYVVADEAPGRLIGVADDEPPAIRLNSFAIEPESCSGDAVNEDRARLVLCNALGDFFCVSHGTTMTFS